MDQQREKLHNFINHDCFIGIFVPDREVHGVGVLRHRVRLHGGALPDDDPEHGHRQLQHRRQGRRHLRPPRLTGEDKVTKEVWDHS